MSSEGNRIDMCPICCGALATRYSLTKDGKNSCVLVSCVGPATDGKFCGATWSLTTGVSE